jgi:sensor histidine kinase regulating citrate/malate metabolism
VRNTGTIPADVARRIFQRHFSTKDGQGRGLGTYAMKLFGEEFLDGSVDFSSTAEDGTVFTLTLPV